ncbi:MAG: helix-hairpin-helix domain-containing protein [Firmicutes bacterium]|nr:helix-hairpin-helix domain-containing protein [Bacillota bacterium]
MKSTFRILFRFVRERRAPFIAGLVVLVAGILYMRGWLAQGKDVYVLRKEAPLPEIPSDAVFSAEAAVPDETPAGKIVVYITGEVVNPGVYEADAGSRVNDALTMAGGATDEADLERINLASPLSDGEQITVPKIGDGEDEVPVIQEAQAADAGGENAGPVNINTAGEAGLDALPGIGPATAKAIIEYRTKNGAFGDISDIKNVSGIGDAKYEQIKDLITVK